MLEQHDGGRVEVERIPELPHEQSQTVEIANVQVGRQFRRQDLCFFLVLLLLILLLTGS